MLPLLHLPTTTTTTTTALPTDVWPTILTTSHRAPDGSWPRKRIPPLHVLQSPTPSPTPPPPPLYTFTSWPSILKHGFFLLWYGRSCSKVAEKTAGGGLI